MKVKKERALDRQDKTVANGRTVEIVGLELRLRLEYPLLLGHGIDRDLVPWMKQKVLSNAKRLADEENVS